MYSDIAFSFRARDILASISLEGFENLPLSIKDDVGVPEPCDESPARSKEERVRLNGLTAF